MKNNIEFERCLSKVSLFFFLFIAISLVSVSQVKDTTQIREVLRKELEYFNKKNLQSLLDLYAPIDSVRVIGGKNLALFGKKEISEFHLKYYEYMGTMYHTGVSIDKVSEDCYHVNVNALTTFSHSKYPEIPDIRSRVFYVMKKIENTWFIYIQQWLDSTMAR